MSARPVGVVGAGTMGAGIAQVAAVAGRRVLLADADGGVAARAVAAIRDRVRDQVARGRLEADADALDLAAVDGIGDLADCDVVIEAVAEDLAAKRGVFARLEEVVAAGALLASNSSSLTPTAMAAGLAHPGRLVGMHFFNPVPAMKLVEVISGLATAPEAAETAAGLARDWGKIVVRSAATPGFIVNRIARPFYAEAWRAHEEGAASFEVIDAVLTGAGGFRMGPFELMDMIGHDVNEAVTRSVHAAFGHDPRFAPSLAQRALVEAGWLGRKTGRGCYVYEGSARVRYGESEKEEPVRTGSGPAAVTGHGPSSLRVLLVRSGARIRPGDGGEEGLLAGTVELPSGAVLDRCNGASATSLAFALQRPVIVVDRTLDDASASAIAIAPSDGCPPGALAEAAGLLRAAGLAVHVIADIPGMLVTRTVAMLVNLAADAVASGVASAAHVDVAMRLGVSYPRGPLAWGQQWGARTVLTILDSLENWYRDGHYRAAPALRRAVLSGRPLSPGVPPGAMPPTAFPLPRNPTA